MRYPTVEIAAVDKSEKIAAMLADLQFTEIVIFTSVNAVAYAHAAAPLPQLLPKDCRVLAVGPATANALQELGVEALVPNDEHSSQGLLALTALQGVAAKKIALVRGHGGLSTLPNTLRERGAELQIFNVYQRLIPADNARFRALFTLQSPQIISATSNETLSNLVTLVPVKTHAHLWPTPVIVNSERGEEYARTLGFSGAILRASPVGDQGQINTLKAWITQRITQR